MELSSQPQIGPGTAVRGPRLCGERSDGLTAPAHLARACGQTQNLTCTCVCRRWQGPCCPEGPAASECHLEIEIEDEMAAAFAWRVRPGPATMHDPARTSCNVAQLPPALHLATVRSLGSMAA